MSIFQLIIIHIYIESAILKRYLDENLTEKTATTNFAHNFIQNQI